MLKETLSRQLAITTNLLKNRKSNEKNRNNGFSHDSFQQKSTTKLLTITFLTLLFTVIGLQQQHNCVFYDKEMNTLLKEMAVLEDEYKALQEEIPQLQSFMEFQNKRSSQDSKRQCNSQDSKRQSLEDEAKKKLNSFSKMVENEIELREELVHQVQRSTLYSYGKGPYKVEMTLEFPSPSNDSTSSSTLTEEIVIEMAPLDMMPYAVSFFLNQIYDGFYNGHAFDINAGHVMIATPSSPQNQAIVQKTAIQEHNPRYPHSQYTLGFTTKEKGSNFYISTQDNTIAHGHSRETCFAKVVQGFHTVDKLSNMHTPNGHYGLLTNYATIIDTRIILNSKD